MTNEDISAKILSFDSSIEIVEGKKYNTATVNAALWHTLAVGLKENASLQFDYLYCLSGIDIDGKLGVVYHLESTTLNHQLVIKTYATDRENPSIDTVSDIWKTADFLEREVFDLFGIKFNNHPDLRRIFLDEAWVGYPLRKDYVDEINIVER